MTKTSITSPQLNFSAYPNLTKDNHQALDDLFQRLNPETLNDGKQIELTNGWPIISPTGNSNGISRDGIFLWASLVDDEGLPLIIQRIYEVNPHKVLTFK